MPVCAQSEQAAQCGLERGTSLTRQRLTTKLSLPFRRFVSSSRSSKMAATPKRAKISPLEGEGRAAALATIPEWKEVPGFFVAL